jgi:hypothetical protein
MQREIEGSEVGKAAREANRVEKGRLARSRDRHEATGHRRPSERANPSAATSESRGLKGAGWTPCGNSRRKSICCRARLRQKRDPIRRDAAIGGRTISNVR